MATTKQPHPMPLQPDRAALGTWGVRLTDTASGIGIALLRSAVSTTRSIDRGLAEGSAERADEVLEQAA